MYKYFERQQEKIDKTIPKETEIERYIENVKRELYLLDETDRYEEIVTRERVEIAIRNKVKEKDFVWALLQ